ncbi:MAG: DPP IV N-terminal domain-containing protein [Bacteroidales bacterium]|nr:DPP IV N-terminal domain-containing protein [Bacteroidales bacterium]
MKKLLILGLLVSASATMMAQGTAEDYARAYKVRRDFTRDKVTGEVDGARWRDNFTLTFSLRNAEGRMENKEAVISTDGTVTVQAETPRTNGENGREGDRRQGGRNGRGDNQMPVTSTKTGPQKLQNHWMNVDEQRAGRPATSPDGKKVAYIRDYNVWVSDANGQNAKQLSFDGTLSHYYSAYLSWSPDSRYVAVNKVRPAEKRYVYYVESSPKTQLQPILHQQEYAKPGDELLQEYPHVFEVATAKDIMPSNELFPNPYEIRGPQWNDDSSAITFEYNERGHKVFRVLEMNVETGNVRVLAEEKSDKYVNYNRYYRYTLKDGKQMIWMSERDNWTHLYLVDIDQKLKVKSEKLKVQSSQSQKSKTTKPQNRITDECPMHQITKGEWVVRQVLKVDEDKQTIYFTASGVNKDEDPYLVHYYKISFDGKNMVCLTPEDGNHSARFNDNYTYLVDTYSKVDTPPVTVLRSVDDPSKVTVLGRADISRLEAVGFRTPEVFKAPGRDGKTMMWGVVYRPTNFDPSRKYPIIEYIYAGPGDAYTPKSFQPYNWNFTSLAELGFIVVQLDAMGTSYRGRDFEQVCYKNLKDAGFPDRIAWIKALAEKYPYMDADNVGIYGCSAGGQESTTAVLLHGDFYKAAYSACGCHDNRMDKIWWNEQWMGYPVDSAYVECSNVTNAHKLERPLMLVVGELDDNVDPASTMQVVDALIKANKDFELVVIPGAHHTMGEDFGERKRHDFFVRNLLGVKPPKWQK